RVAGDLHEACLRPGADRRFVPRIGIDGDVLPARIDQRPGERPRRIRHQPAATGTGDEKTVESAAPWRTALPPRLQVADRFAVRLDDPRVHRFAMETLEHLVPR